MEEMLKFVNSPSTSADVARIALSYLSNADQTTIYEALVELGKQRPLTWQEESAKKVVGSGAVANARALLAEFQAEYGLDAEHGLNIEAPLPPLTENDAWNLGAELNAAREAKQDADNPPDIGDGVNHNGDGPNGGDNNAGDLNGPDDDHKEGELIEGEHGR